MELLRKPLFSAKTPPLFLAEEACSMAIAVLGPPGVGFIGERGSSSSASFIWKRFLFEFLWARAAVVVTCLRDFLVYS
jgi:hypothetical protein